MKNWVQKNTDEINTEEIGDYRENYNDDVSAMENDMSPDALIQALNINADLTLEERQVVLNFQDKREALGGAVLPDDLQEMREMLNNKLFQPEPEVDPEYKAFLDETLAEHKAKEARIAEARKETEEKLIEHLRWDFFQKNPEAKR